MSKTRSITFETYDSFECTLSNIAVLLGNAGWSFKNADGKVNVYDINGDDEWSVFDGSYEEFLVSELNGRLIEIYHHDGQTAEICVGGEHTFAIFLASYIKMTDTTDGHVDLNWYYENLVENFNRETCLIMCVKFEEHY
ncbi:MAG: hypothetical protein J6A16_09390 [Oscillospiraceae bacterium]|nr:hypothetical protein [Oscillospiraceae bacterium]